MTSRKTVLIRHARIAFVCGLACASSCVNPLAAETGTATSHRLESLRQSFPYAPAAALAVEKSSETDAEPIVLERLTIVESIQRRQLAADINQRSRRDAEEKFAWEKGGTLYTRRSGNRQMDVGLWAHVEVPRMGDPGPANVVRLKVELLKFKW